MSQEQPERPQAAEQPQQPIKYGDVFDVSGDLADQPVAPQDAALMQAAETAVLGQTQKAGPAAAMQAAATINERAGLVGHDDATEAAREGGVTVAETEFQGTRLVTESVAGQVVGQYYEATSVLSATGAAPQAMVTIGEALEAAGRAAGNKPVDHGDAAAIQAAECRATGSSLVAPGGLAAAAQSAAAYNDGFAGNEGRVKLADILSNCRCTIC
ncbi:late embryogenesis abundant protein D-34-like isoform X2 [Salvia miltiorrhiza]|uniref:late embryogenesis abundant protein D-34-like isoform X2 n=1 Tax=Salvia miltiorrhiza TaxID=226208 RepID=UPI0025ACB2D8|nr:late embryogenesis abundant protein D-34-like isoform X2 [Salvia miltiorrhiza]